MVSSKFRELLLQWLSSEIMCLAIDEELDKLFNL